MSDFTILYDDSQEAEWFHSLHPDLENAKEVSITEAQDWPSMRKVLAYDRPDIVLLHHLNPILVVEETKEVPTGHNVWQRFSRIVAAAEAGVPFLYFGPYAAKKHGGETAGPRYINGRLFKALDALTRRTGATVTTINWSVDKKYEVRLGKDKDGDVQEYVKTLLDFYSSSPDLSRLSEELRSSAIHLRMVEERNNFVRDVIKRPMQYDIPPKSVRIMTPRQFSQHYTLDSVELEAFDKLVVYCIGTNEAIDFRADPYTGAAMAYRELYVLEHISRALVLWFPEKTEGMWRSAATNPNRKEIRLFPIAANAILFKDNLVLRKNLVPSGPRLAGF